MTIRNLKWDKIKQSSDNAASLYYIDATMENGLLFHQEIKHFTKSQIGRDNLKQVRLCIVIL